jgi:hypothetical protein
MHDCQLEMWGLQNHRKAFQKVFDRKMMVEDVKLAGEATALKQPAPDSAETPGG